MQATAGSTFPNGAAVFVYQPNGTTIAAVQLYSGSDTKIDLGALPASGTYTVVIIPEGANTGQVALRLVSGASDTLVVGDPAKTLGLAAAQNGRYSFTGNAGDLLSLGVTALTTTPVNGTVYFNVYKPDGSFLGYFSAYGPANWQLPQLPTTGTYTLSAQPPGTAAASFTLLLSSAITGTLASDGTPTHYATTRVGQSGRYSFSGTAGQRFTMQATAGAGFSGSLAVTAYQPSGASIGGAQLSSGNDVKIDLGALPASGTYTVTVIPSGVTLGTVDLRLVSGATDTLVVGDPPKALSLSAAQNGRYTFTANAGDLLNASVTALTTTPSGGAVYFTIYKPDGSYFWSFSASAPATWQVPQLPTTGAYALSVQPPGTAGAAFTIQLTRR